MQIKTLVPALLAIAMLAGLTPAGASTTAAPTKPVASAATTDPARAQLALEAGLTPKQAENMSLSQLAWYKMQRDGEDVAHAYTQVTPSHS